MGRGVIVRSQQAGRSWQLPAGQESVASGRTGMMMRSPSHIGSGFGIAQHAYPTAHATLLSVVYPRSPNRWMQRAATLPAAQTRRREHRSPAREDRARKRPCYFRKRSPL